MSLRTPAAVLGVLGAVALVLVQFLPWGGIATEGGSAFGFDFPGSKVDAYTWKMSAEAGGNKEKESWYSDDMESDEGDEDSTDADLMKVRIAIPLLLAGLIIGALGGLLGFLGRGPYGIVLMVAGVLAAAGTVLFAIGVDGFFDSDQDWAASFYLAIVASAVLLVGGVLGLVGGDRGASS